MIFTASRLFSSSVRTSSKPISVALPGPSIRPDTSALQAFARHLRNLTTASIQTHSAPEPEAHWQDTVPGSFGLLVQGRRAED